VRRRGKGTKTGQRRRNRSTRKKWKKMMLKHPRLQRMIRHGLLSFDAGAKLAGIQSSAADLKHGTYCVSTSIIFLSAQNSRELRPSQCTGIGGRLTHSNSCPCRSAGHSLLRTTYQNFDGEEASTEGHVEDKTRTRLRRQSRDAHGEGVRLVPAEHLAAARGHADEAPVLLHVPALDEQHLLAQVHHGARPALHYVSR
jgi:hypothetical protein